MSVFGWLTDLFFAKEEMDRQNSKVIQTGSRAGGRVVRGDMCGGNFKSFGKMPADGSYINGNFEISNFNVTVQQIVDLDIEVGGSVIINGTDVTTEYRKLRGR